MTFIRWTIYYLLRWPELVFWCFMPVVNFFDAQVKWERRQGLRP